MAPMPRNKPDDLALIRRAVECFAYLWCPLGLAMLGLIFIGLTIP